MVAGELQGQESTRSGSAAPVDAEPGPGPDAARRPLNLTERGQLDVIRRFGTIGALFLAAGSLGAGAAPVFNPVSTLPLVGLFTRMPTVALASAITGVFMLIVAWLWLGRFVRAGRTRLLSRTQLDRTLLMWLVPLALVPPMFSRDVYSYLAQSKIAALGLDPYELGPAEALTVSDPLTRGVPNLWRDTPAPYGPLFLTMGRGITALIGDHVVTGALLHRALELVGVAMIVWALPRLARRCGIEPVRALWLGAANPLIIWHLVVGSHNEALMIGLMMVGLEIGLRALPRDALGTPLTRTDWALLVAGTTVITLGAAVKITALPALGFLGIALARRLGGRVRDVAVAAVALLAVSGVVLVGVSVATGLGFGWVNALGVPGVVKTWMSPMTALGFLTTGLGLLFGFGNHGEAAVEIMRAVGTVASGIAALVLLWRTLRGRLEPTFGLALCLSAVVVFGATVQPWYLLWALPLLAASCRWPRLRAAVVLISVGFAVIVPPTGSSFDGHVYVVPEAYVAGGIVTLLAIFLVRRKLPVLPFRNPAADKPTGTGADTAPVSG